MSQFAQPISLTGVHAALLPLAATQHDALCTAVQDGDLWKLWYTAVPKPEGMHAEILRRLDLQAKHSMLPFAVKSVAENRIVGMTTYMNIDATQKRVEIGSTWYAKSVQRTAVNTECKLLLLTHAFETLNCVAVEFRTSYFNHASRNAILRLGAKQDGILRSHQRHPDGSLRDTCVYSIIAAEWPAVRQHLQFCLTQSRGESCTN